MKRSEKFTHQARQYFWMAAAVLAASVALVCWVPTAVLSEQSDPGGIAAPVAVGTLTLALIGLVIAIAMTIEGIRLRTLSRIERGWEYDREVR